MNKHVYDYIPDFMRALHDQLVSDESRWGQTWLNRTRKGQESRIQEDLDRYFYEYSEKGVPVPWLKIAGLALIGWIRETFPE